MNSLIRFAKETAVGLAASVTPIAKRLEEAQTAQVEQRHPLHESIQLLNAMRAAGGIRRVHKGYGDNGAVEGQTPEKILRHTDFDSLHESMVTGEDRKDPGPGWAGYGPIIESEPPRKFSREEVASVNMNSTSVTLQDELFGS
jgi:hypothetical protein